MQSAYVLVVSNQREVGILSDVCKGEYVDDGVLPARDGVAFPLPLSYPSSPGDPDVGETLTFRGVRRRRDVRDRVHVARTGAENGSLDKRRACIGPRPGDRGGIAGGREDETVCRGDDCAYLLGVVSKPNGAGRRCA